MHLALEMNGFFLLIFAWTCNCDRIFFNSCGRGGFSCVNTEDKKHNLTLNCNAETKQDILIYLWSFRAPASIANLKIQNCENVTLYTTCTAEGRLIKSLWLLNITNLFMMSSPVPHTPQILILENIGRINTLPKEIFSHALTRSNRPGCTPLGMELRRFFFKNVNIGVIETEAFYNISKTEIFTWDNVTVGVMQTGALKMVLDKAGRVEIENSKLNVLEHLAFQITGEDISFVGNTLVDVHASAVNGTILNFNFYNNTVENFQSNGFSLLSQNVYLLDNRFEYLHSGALQKISPGLLFDSNTNFGRLRFIYRFVGNSVRYADVGGLHPDTVAYDNVASNVTFARNALLCSCEKLGWISMQIGLGHSQAGMIGFYKEALDEKNKNVCTFASCTLPLKTIAKLYERCLDGNSFKDYCEDTKKPKVIEIEFDARNGSTEKLLELNWASRVHSTYVAVVFSIFLLFS